MARVLTVALVCGLGASLARAQNSTSSVPLGDLARQLKAQRAKSPGKSKVYTNDNLPTQSPMSEQGAPSPTSGEEAKPGEKSAQETSGNEAGTESRKAPSAETSEQAHGEQYYRERMAKLQDRLELDQRELSVLEQKLGQNQMQYYPDPLKGLLQESGPTAMSDIHKLQDEIAKQKDKVAADQKAIDDLQGQLRHEGGDPAWLR
jgi:hypothetical protein